MPDDSDVSFDDRKARASGWFRELRDSIVAAFEALEDSQSTGPFAEQPAGRFEGPMVCPSVSFRELFQNGEDGFLISRINRETLGPPRPPGLHRRARSRQ